MLTPAREVAYRVLLRVEREASYAAELLNSRLAAQLSPADRGLAQEIVMGCIRWQAQLDWLVARFAGRPVARLDLEIRIVLRMGIYQLRFLERVPASAAVDQSVELTKHARKRSAAGFVNAVLRKVTREPIETLLPLDMLEAERRAIVLAHPAWLLERWARHYGWERAEAIARINNQPPPLFVRLPVTERSNGPTVPESNGPTAQGSDGRELADTGETSALAALALQLGAPCRYVRDCRDLTGEAERAREGFAIQDQASQIVPHLLLAPVVGEVRGPTGEDDEDGNRRRDREGAHAQAAGGDARGPGAGVPETRSVSGWGAGGDARAPRERAAFRVLDLCAAPGVKTSQIRELAPQAHIVACDLHPSRLRLVEQLAGESFEARGSRGSAFALPTSHLAPRTSHLVPADLVALDGTCPLPFAVAFDCILVDAPCSGSGTIRRNPEIKWRLEPAHLAVLATKQRRLLSNALDWLAPGGRLVYSTCSIEPEENQGVVEEVLSGRNDCRLIPVEQLTGDFLTEAGRELLRGRFFQTLPDQGLDGFFAAVIEKVPRPSSEY